MKYLLLALAFVSVSTAYSQDTRSVEPFDKLVVSGKLDVVLERGTQERVIIESTDVPEDKINLTRRGNTLRIGLVDGWFTDRYERVRVRVQYTDLYMVRAAAGAHLRSNESITSDRLEVKATSGAEVTLDIATQTLEAGAAEGAILELTGTAETQFATANTGGEYDASDLQVTRTEVRANTGGKALVLALDELDATANTGGMIYYGGEPNHKYTKTNLAGEIRQM